MISLSMVPGSSFASRGRRRGIATTAGAVTLALLTAVLFSCASSSGGGLSDAVSGASPVAPAERPIVDMVDPIDAGRVLVVFFSQGAATRRVAEDLAALTGADLEEITELRERSGFMRAGGAATFRIASRINKPRLDPLEYDHVIVCTPVWAWSLSPPVRAWLVRTRGTLRSAAFVTVAADTKPDRIVKDMERTARVEPVATAGFNERDFLPENAADYAARIAGLMGSLR